ncbi:MAG: ABC transporter ATP-binding protein [Dehalococcoidaceae bacterium]|nr:ABC transporter ATP-binding protein [Dehalococcoidaceae bacterium]
MSEILRVERLSKYFSVSRDVFGKSKHFTPAVKDVSFSICRGETLGLVGESGCGKSTLGRMIAGLLSPSGGSIYFEGSVIASAQHVVKAKKPNIQMVFQNPYSSLDPKMTLRGILEEPLKISRYNKEQCSRRIDELLEYIDFNRASLTKRPREFSGGQRQRIAIARAIATNPPFIIADEPVSSLDVSIQAQILNLLLDLRKELDLTYLFISHDLGVVQYISNRVIVMYLGRIVEMADCQTIYKSPQHPYTRLLIDSVPIPDPKHKQAFDLSVTNDLLMPGQLQGCLFKNRCPEKMPVCCEQEPNLVSCGERHLVACHNRCPENNACTIVEI